MLLESPNIPLMYTHKEVKDHVYMENPFFSSALGPPVESWTFSPGFSHHHLYTLKLTPQFILVVCAWDKQFKGHRYRHCSAVGAKLSSLQRFIGI